jgi:hypothetical protein
MAIPMTFESGDMAARVMAAKVMAGGGLTICKRKIDYLDSARVVESWRCVPRSAGADDLFLTGKRN